MHTSTVDGVGARHEVAPRRVQRRGAERAVLVSVAPAVSGSVYASFGLQDPALVAVERLAQVMASRASLRVVSAENDRQ